MDKYRNFIVGQKSHIEATLKLLREARSRPESGIEHIAMATMAQNIYTGMENVLRTILEMRKTKIEKSGAWHKELLTKAVEAGIISEDTKEILMEYLIFRHFHIHGYGYMLKWDELKPIVEGMETVVERFFTEINERGGF